MTDIKFRAWHRKEQRMISPQELSEGGYHLDLNGRGLSRIPPETGKLQYFSVMLPLIYSGHMDRNNNEIYEADIVRYQNRVYQVLWYDAGLWMIREDGKPVDLAFSSAEVEVIGNLYSHPERINA